MQFKQSLQPLRGLFKITILTFLLSPGKAGAQTTYLPQDARENVLLERMQIKKQNNPVLNFSTARPFSRQHVVPVVENEFFPFFKQLAPSLPLSIPYREDTLQVNSDTALQAYYKKSGYSKVDYHNARQLLMNSSEWASRNFSSRKKFLNHFYKSPGHFYEVNTKDFFLSLNPVFQYYVGKEQDNDQHIFLNTRGITLRGRIGNKIGFAAYMTDNQERTPLYVQRFVTDRKAVPGAGFYKDFKQTAYDYFDARGSVSFNAARFIDIQFGYDKNFLGNGHRSLFLSDFSAPTLFLKLNTRIWKFNYQNLFMELNSANRLNADQLLPKKYAAMHHLDLAVTKWLNIGLFEGVVFGRTNHFEFGYLNPVIFYRSVEQQSGSFDNSVLGLDAKANIARSFQFYGQFMLDEFNLKELRRASGWWANKIGYQLGAKYIDAFGLANLDLQAEVNRVRPFTYSHRDSVANYTHYNQPLAHPLGANFHEMIAIARYQPAPKWFIQARGVYYMQGRDTGNVNHGSNIFLPNVFPYRNKDFGYNLGDAVRSKTAYASLLVSYEWRPNFYVEASAVIRRENATSINPSRNTMVVYAGIRWNMHRREFDF